MLPYETHTKEIEYRSVTKTHEINTAQTKCIHIDMKKSNFENAGRAKHGMNINDIKWKGLSHGFY